MEQGGARKEASERFHETAFPGLGGRDRGDHQLARLLQQRRIQLGLSQTQVAARMGTSQSAVARIESGARDVRLSSLQKMAAALGGELELGLRLDGSTNE